MHGDIHACNDPLTKVLLPIYMHISYTDALSAHNTHEESWMVYKYGGDPVASFLPHPTHTMLKPTIAHTMFMNATLNNDPGHIQVQWQVVTLNLQYGRKLECMDFKVSESR